jgi:dTDP-L-rhamnose 4-epimerase
MCQNLLSQTKHMKILITGGAGFIGSYVVERLLDDGHSVVILDNCDSLVHGVEGRWPDYLPANNSSFKKIKGDVRDYGQVINALNGADAVIHLASKTSVCLSKLEENNYRETNCGGTEVLKKAIKNTGTVKKVVLSSSRAVYGEGAYVNENGLKRSCFRRRLEDIRVGDFEVKPDPALDRSLMDVPTSEDTPPCPVSVYGQTKLEQEEILLGMKEVSVRVLRYFNVYGPRQALNNPYVGIMAHFVKTILAGQELDIYEDGLMKRDFVSVHDVVAATLLALYRPAEENIVCNIGSGQIITILDAARRIAKTLQKDLKYVISGHHREGDIRHCYADLNNARATLGYVPRTGFDEGMKSYIPWVVKRLGTNS